MTATLRVQCPQCGKHTTVPESVLGKTGRCSACQHRFVIEAPKTAAEDDEFGLSPAEAVTLVAAARKDVWHEAAPVEGGKSQGQASLEAIIRRKEKVKVQYDASDLLTMGLMLGGAGLLVLSGIVGILIYWMTSEGGPLSGW
jgi:hypothetical protein